MATLPGTDFNIDLPADERVLSSVPAEDFFASKHSAAGSTWRVVITDRRLIAFARRGVIRKRLDEVVSWPLTSFTERIRTSGGSALESYMHVLTLFAHDGETVSTGFKDIRDYHTFKQDLTNALGSVRGKATTDSAEVG
jgi:hypothetical protein